MVSAQTAPQTNGARAILPEGQFLFTSYVGLATVVVLLNERLTVRLASF